ncbi:hypothetical protein [Terrabacter carboxydivorans]|uniref:Uncharacterized protein n=1 Tax=Terrabacter carboxydivorans TaxID=619730 RepID=A0ABN3MBY6_9MICO
MSRVRRHAVLLGLMPAVLLVMLFWRQPRPPTVSAIDTLEDVVLAALGIVIIIGIAGSLHVKTLTTTSRYVRLVGAFAAVLLSGMVLLAGIAAAPARFWVMLLAAAGVAGGAWVAWRTWRSLPRNVLAGRREKLALAALALALPGIQAWHAIAFIQATQNVSVSVSPALETQGTVEATGEKKVRLSLTVANKGQARALVLISLATYCWVPDTDQGMDKPLAKAVAAEDLAAMRNLPGCGSTRPVRQTSWIDPGTELSVSRALVAPLDKSRLLVGVRVAYARGDRLQTAPTTDGPLPIENNGPCVRGSYLPVLAESRVKS